MLYIIHKTLISLVCTRTYDIKKIVYTHNIVYTNSTLGKSSNMISIWIRFISFIKKKKLPSWKFSYFFKIEVTESEIKEEIKIIIFFVEWNMFFIWESSISILNWRGTRQYGLFQITRLLSYESFQFNVNS